MCRGRLLPFYTPGGVASLDAAIDTTIGTTPNTKVVVFAYSNGAQVAEHWLAEHADDPDAPSANQLSFVLLGNSTRAYGGVDAGWDVAPQTQYHVVDVARQYDLTVDFPDNPFNLLALANVFAGLVFMHDYRPVNITDPANFVWTVGNTTYVLVPTENLPLLEPLRWVGLSGWPMRSTGR